MDLLLRNIMPKVLEVRLVWDEEARVWVATSDDIPGLVTEAETREALAEKLKVMVPELLAANGVSNGDEIPLKLLSECTVIAHRELA